LDQVLHRDNPNTKADDQLDRYMAFVTNAKFDDTREMLYLKNTGGAQSLLTVLRMGF